MLFLAPYREIELDRAHPLAAALVEWNRERLAHAHRARPPVAGGHQRAARDAVRPGFVSDDFAAALFRETEGNPFFVEEVVKSLIEQGQIFREGGGWGAKSVQELDDPAERQGGDRPAARPDLRGRHGYAAHGGGARQDASRFSELAVVSAAGEDALLDALDEGSAAQLVRAVDGSESFAFTHDKIREVLYEEMNPIRRRRLHQRIGEALERMSATRRIRRAYGPRDGRRARAGPRASFHAGRATSSARSCTCARRPTMRSASSRTTRR